MTALAHELAGLIGPLHGLSPNSNRRRKVERRPILNPQTPAPPLRLKPSGRPEK
jgi:hypothetical protein